LLGGALAAHALVHARRRALVAAARLCLGAGAVWFTLGQVYWYAGTVALVPAWIPPSPAFWAIATTVAFGLAAVAILIDRRAVLAARLMGVMLALFGAIVWVPIAVAHPRAHFDWSECLSTWLIAGASFCVAAAGETAPGMR
jgi:uncharacterized membrane protein YphA (DoxX/SURF4 family)